MTCREFPLLYSAQIDGRADEHEQLALQKHLRECAACRGRAAELRCLLSDLRVLGGGRVLESPRAEPELTAQIQSALQREARLQASHAMRRADLFDLWRIRIFSQSIAAVVSMVMLIAVASVVFSRAYRALNIVHTATGEILGEKGSDEIKLKLLLLQPPPPPVFSPSGDLLGFGASLSEDGEIIATVKVHKDGRASVNQIIGTPVDPTVVQKFSHMIMQQASFQPTRRDRNTSAEAVVIFSSMNISPGTKGPEIN
jgi:Putative zinc-finger